MASNNFIQFPSNFIWGAATSAYQIEGAWNEGGRGMSIWDTFCLQEGKINNGEHGEVAANHYQLWPEDVAIMSELGLQTYRFSISWPRIFPFGNGKINTTGLDFYDCLVDALLEKNILPFVTLYHWDLPQALQDKGGWGNRDTANHFADYARVIAERLGDRVKYWITHNEPMVTAMSGHLLGDHAPGIQDPIIALQAGYHLLLSHGLAIEALRSVLPSEAQVGITLNLNPFYPASESDKDRLAAQRGDALLNGLFLEPLFCGHFPAEVSEMIGPLLPVPQPGDFEHISNPLDFLGINYYSRIILKHDPAVILGQATQIQPEGNEYSQMWEIYPPGLYELLSQVWGKYHPSKIFITENGVPVPDGVDFDGKIRDYRRIRYLRDHLQQIHRAIKAGIPVQGYMVWSLLDNFEWAYGYQMRFGLVYVDFDNQKRTIKESGRWYSQVIQQNGFSPEAQLLP